LLAGIHLAFTGSDMGWHPLEQKVRRAKFRASLWRLLL
jgi:hypothetical protein